jgi:hypothetical protein
MGRNLVGEEELITVSEQEIVQLTKAGKLKPDTKLASGTRTKGKWHLLKSVPSLLQIYEQGAASRAQLKQEQVEQRRRKKEETAARAESVHAQKRFAIESASAEARLVSDSSNIDLILKIKERVSAILTSGETVEFIVVQDKPVVNIAPDAVVCTNRRLIFYRPKVLGRFDFNDYLWRDLGNAHLSQGVIRSKFSAMHVGGAQVSMDYLPKDESLKLYRYAQEREEEAIEIRRQRQMEIQRAGAANISMPSAPANSGQPVSDAGANDPASRIKKLKSLLEQELITQDEFDARKREILSDI